MLTVLVRAYFPQIAEGKADGGVLAGDGGDCEAARDPNWMMLVPLLLFAVAIIGLGLHSAPLMRVLAVIGGEAG